MSFIPLSFSFWLNYIFSSVLQTMGFLYVCLQVITSFWVSVCAHSASWTPSKQLPEKSAIDLPGTWLSLSISFLAILLPQPSQMCVSPKLPPIPPSIKSPEHTFPLLGPQNLWRSWTTSSGHNFQLHILHQMPISTASVWLYFDYFCLLLQIAYCLVLTHRIWGKVFVFMKLLYVS